MSEPISPRRPGHPRKAPVCDCGLPGVLRVKSDWICDRCLAWEHQFEREQRRAGQHIRIDRELQNP